MAGQSKKSAKKPKSVSARLTQRIRTYKNKKVRIELQLAKCEIALKRKDIDEKKKVSLKKHIDFLHNRLSFWHKGTIGVK